MSSDQSKALRFGGMIAAAAVALAAGYLLDRFIRSEATSAPGDITADEVLPKPEGGMDGIPSGENSEQNENTLSDEFDGIMHGDQEHSEEHVLSPTYHPTKFSTPTGSPTSEQTTIYPEHIASLISSSTVLSSQSPNTNVDVSVPPSVTSHLNDYIAINIAMLPTPPAFQAATAANQFLVQYAGSFVFGPCRFAHLTFAQLYIAKEDLPFVIADVQAILSHFLRRQSQPSIVEFNDIHSKGPALPNLSIASNDVVEAVHHQMSETLRKYRAYPIARDEQGEVTDDGLARAQTCFHLDKFAPYASRGSIDYVDSFFEKGAFDDYYPHITVGDFKVRQKRLTGV